MFFLKNVELLFGSLEMIQIQNRMNRKQRTHKLCKKSILHFLLVFQIPLESITLHLYCTVEKLWKYLNLVLLLQNVNNNTSQINQCLNKLTFYQIPVSLSFIGFLKNTNHGIQISSSLDFRVACSSTFSNHFHFTLSNFWLLFYNSLWFAPFLFDMFMLHTTRIKSHFT